MAIITITMITPSLFDSQQYYCEQRAELGVVQCDNFSKYVASNGKCIRNENTNLICREGWKEVINDIDLPEETEVEKVIIHSDSTGKSYIVRQGLDPIAIE